MICREMARTWASGSSATSSLDHVLLLLISWSFSVSTTIRGGASGHASAWSWPSSCSSILKVWCLCFRRLTTYTTRWWSSQSFGYKCSQYPPSQQWSNLAWKLKSREMMADISQQMVKIKIVLKCNNWTDQMAAKDELIEWNWNSI